MSADAAIEGYLGYMAHLGKRVVASAFHARITTHGGSYEANCHPFPIGNNPQNLLFHNGMLPITEKNGKSDTRLFAEDYLPVMGGAPALESEIFIDMLEEWMGYSKFVLLSIDPALDYPLTIINEKLGFWEGDLWFSNGSCHAPRTVSSWTQPVASADGIYCKICKTENDTLDDTCSMCWACLDCGQNDNTCLCWAPEKSSDLWTSELEMFNGR